MSTYIIAEIGNTHEGSMGLAKCFIQEAKNCGVNAVKFQTHIFSVESLSSAPNPPYFTDENRKEYFERTSFTLEQYRELRRFSEDVCGIDFISSAFSIEAAILLINAGVKIIKVPSGEVTNTPLLEYLAKSDCRVILSSGMSTWRELDKAYSILSSVKDLVILQCTSEYPCPPEKAGLNVITELKIRYKCNVGFSDHTLGVSVPIAAVVLGAKIIEKHFTLSKLMYGSDAINSMEPKEFKILVSEIRNVEKALDNSIDKDLIDDNLKLMKTVFEKSIVVANFIQKGQVVRFNDLAFKKPGNGIPASDYNLIIGKKANCDLNKDHLLSFADVE